MNKISKKIVALATMAAFVLTLVPGAAFAQVGQADRSTSFSVTETAYDTAEVDIHLGNNDVTESHNVVVWVTDGQKVLVPKTDVTYTLGANTTYYNNTTAENWNNEGIILSTAADMTVEVKIPDVGYNKDYTVHVGLNENTPGAQSLDQLQQLGTGKTFTTEFADADYSGYGVVKNGAVEKTATVAVDEVLKTSFVVNHAYNQGTDDALNGVNVWAEEQGKEGTQSTAVAFDGTPKTGNYGTVTNGSPEVDVTFDKAGTYTLRAATADGDLQYTTVVTVTDKEVVAAKIEDVTAKTSNNGTDDITFDASNMGELDLTTVDPNFDYDGIDKVTISGTVVDEDGNPVQGKTVTATTNKDSVVELDNNAESDVTDNFGHFDITFVIKGQSNATVTLTVADTDLSYTIQIWAKKTAADNIDRTLTGGYVLAGNDSKYGDAVYGGNATVSFADAVQFKVTGDGEEMTGDAAIAGSKIDVRTVPNGSTLKDNNKTTVNGDSTNVLALVWDKENGVYTLAYTGATYATDLIPGKYEVRVALANGDDATVTFNVAKFGKVQDTVLAVTARDYDQSPANPNEEVMTVDDTITLGQQITVNAKYVDENGLKVPAKYVSFNFNGKAVSDWNKWNNVFATEPDIPANDSLIGTTVKVVAFNTANKQLVEKTLTVADSYTDKSLEFSSDNGSISKDNKVNVSVVNEDGKVQQVEGYMTAWVADQSNEDAKISVDVNKNGVHDVQNGKGSLTVYADQETTADIVVVVKAGTEAYYGTLEYTFGSEDALANRTVVMTIDSTDYVVNNKIFTGDAAPYIDSNWRTMVPIRALAEAFDAEVIWNQDDSTVTINFDGDTTIVMTVGETAYTVDGAEATMDTEPVNTGSRVYVPIRFAAEGLGFSVTPLYNADGLTASVVFQR